MNVDDYVGPLKALIAEVNARASEIETEADARFQIIDRMLVEVLGWAHTDFKMEPHNEAGFTDYLITLQGVPTLVIEAKRTGKLLIGTANKELGHYVISGPALKGAKDGFSQAAGYCLEHGVDFAVLTTGEAWIAFIALRGAGKSFRDYKAIVFPTLDAIQSDFMVFYDLFSKEALSKKLYKTHFARLDGVSARAFEPLLSANRTDDARLLQKSKLALDLDPILAGFFGDLSGDNDPELRRHCFVETRESRTADVTLQKMIGNISSSITAIPTDTGRQLTERIDAVMQSQRSENVLIAGGEGAGKSTFITRFFEDILERQHKEACQVVRIDLKDAVDEPSRAQSAVTNAVKLALDKLLFSGGFPRYDDLQGLYFDEYQRWSEGQHKTLYETDKTGFKIKFGEFLDDALRSDPFTYVTHLLRNVVLSRKQLPVLVFDNADSRSVEFQEAVFEWSQTVKRQIPLCLVVFPVSDHTIWRMSREGPLRVADGKIFYLPTPSTKEVLQKRIAYLQENSNSVKGMETYFLGKGINLKLADINAFAACLEEIFINEDFISKRVGWLTNHNLFRSLELTREIITSPYISIEELVSSYLKFGKSAASIKHRKFMQALIAGGYNQFDGSKHGYVRNVFETLSDFPSSPLLILSIIKLLIDKAGEQGTNSTLGYVSFEHINSYFSAMNASEDAIRTSVIVAVRNGLIETFEGGKLGVVDHERFAVTNSGRMHYEMSLRDSVYMGQMAFATPIRSHATVDQLRRIKSSPMRAEEWREIRNIFVEYCLAEDATFLVQPTDPMFIGQKQLRADLAGNWTTTGSDSRRAAYPASDGTTTEMRSHVRATLKWMDAGKGYGFMADAGGGDDIYIPIRLFRQQLIEVPEPGSIIVCDVGPGKEGKPQALTLHSIELAPVAEETANFVPAIVKFYNSEKGFGFVNTREYDGDIYISRWLLARGGPLDLAPGTPVEVVIETDPRRGAQARAIRAVSR